MTDIVERLRSGMVSLQDCWDGADEIEALRIVMKVQQMVYSGENDGDDRIVNVLMSMDELALVITALVGYAKPGSVNPNATYRDRANEFSVYLGRTWLSADLDHRRNHGKGNSEAA